MSRTAVNSKGKTIPDLVDMVAMVVTAMTGNVDFPNPKPSLATFSANAADLDQKFKDAFDGGKSKKKLMLLSREVVLSDLSSQGDYVQSESGGDMTKILSAGFAIKSKKTRKRLLDPPLNVRSTFGIHRGEIIIRWAGVKGRYNYLIQINSTPSDDSKWIDLAHIGTVSYVASGLVSLHEYAFRIATQTSRGYGGWSEVTLQIAL